MRTLLINIGFLILIVANINGQSIISIRRDVFTNYTIKNGIPKRIIKTNTFYNKTGHETIKERIEFSTNLDTIVERRYKNLELYAVLVFVFNKNKELIYRSYNRKIPLIGWQFESTTNNYDKTGLIEIKTFDKQGHLINVATIANDSLKNPISLKLFNSNNQLLGYEIADYNYKTNKWIDKFYDNSGNLKSGIEHRLKPEQTETNIYNDFGDCVLYPRSWNDNGNIYYQVDYKYDKFGNWIQKKIYTVEKVDDKFKNKRINRKFKRKIIYRKTSPNSRE